MAPALNVIERDLTAEHPNNKVNRLQVALFHVRGEKVPSSRRDSTAKSAGACVRAGGTREVAARTDNPHAIADCLSSLTTELRTLKPSMPPHRNLNGPDRARTDDLFHAIRALNKGSI